jgi:hypothetical protein
MEMIMAFTPSIEGYQYVGDLNRSQAFLAVPAKNTHVQLYQGDPCLTVEEARLHAIALLDRVTDSDRMTFTKIEACVLTTTTQSTDKAWRKATDTVWSHWVKSLGGLTCSATALAGDTIHDLRNVNEQ